ncbi:alpha-tocopherol transfer protein-like [Stomoxys calcitrans]|uniref:alpha-tocopherol transfer protein-like n=1 Tax=Stomoxys calcitrans TaxID=35570 RepID=UPI0027E29AA3|nr:alpha-tocopherol transfer protein-like [Stomoxys calcitrans]
MLTTQTKDPLAKFGDFLFKLELFEVSELTLEYARRELNETPENIENGLRELRQLLKDDSQLKTPLESDSWLLGFLRLRNFDPESAYEKIKMYYQFRKRYENLAKTAMPSRLKHIFDMSLALPLPKRDQCERRIVLVRSGKYWDLKKVHKDDFFQAGGMCHELCAMEPASKIHGLVSICDMDGLTVEHALKLTLKYTKRNVESYQEGSSFRPCALHFVNEPSLFHACFKLARPFLNKEWSKCIHFHGNNMESLHKFISPECLPECYGGTMKLELNYGPQFYEVIKMFEEDFIRNYNYGYKK